MSVVSEGERERERGVGEFDDLQSSFGSRCHTVLYKYQAELCAEELADLADQQQQQQQQGYPLLTPPNSSGNGNGGNIITSMTSNINHQLKKPSPDSSTSSCAPLEPITPNSAFNALSDARLVFIGKKGDKQINKKCSHSDVALL